jgi:type I restriction enzyme M protein
MLDTDTKRRIDTARDILVGKVPDPKSQVEQITIALIYKFMDDMDAEAEELGGKRKFFTKEFARYGWAKLMSPSLGGHEMRDLYKEGLAKMPENPGIPPLFRDILKDADLPYRDPETLKSFLKIINEFTYDHSEKLGDAFEYLLSVLGSQGDAGQFRTPRHIIDFMVEVIAPKKGEVILDPACGTAGFLISAWKHILANNTSKPKPSPQPSPSGREGSEAEGEGAKLGRGKSYRGGFDFSGLKDRARELRKKQTDAEALLWDLLRDRQLCDSKFRRQHQFGDYICDFYCHEANLVVECDGKVHDTSDRKKHDQKRDAYLKSQGLTVLRFQNDRVLNDTPAVLEEIATLLPSLRSSPSSSPSGRGGGEGSPGAMPGDLLTPDERGRLSASIRGYDISPDMVRLSLVNLYLHGFADPHIVEYDTLTSEERWNEYADVILANPPFMSPKGGIKPHKRFSIQAKRSEVLFVDYMAEHLTPTGRAAIIVPEGIIFQSQTAYKQLRKMLVENSLVAVVSLPAGCFNPYSGVKTSILILDKALAKKSDSIAFLKIENDGYGLGAQRRAVAGGQLPQAQTELAAYLQALRSKASTDTVLALTSTAQIVPKEKIAANGDYNLSGERYREGAVATSSWPFVTVGDVFRKADKTVLPESLKGPVTYLGLENITQNTGEIEGNVVTEKPADIKSLKNVFKPRDILYGKLRPNLNKVWLADRKGICSTDIFVIEASEETVSPALYAYLFRSAQFNTAVMGQLKGAQLPRVGWSSFAELQIPLPPLEIQKEIVAEIEGYQKVINGARAVLENYRPHIPIHPDWPVVELDQLCGIEHGYAFKGEFFVEEGGEQFPILLTPGNFVQGGGLYFTKKNTKHYSGDVPDAFRLRRGDLVVVMTDLSPMMKILGMPAIIDCDDFLHNQRIGKVVLKSRDVTKAFLRYAFLIDSVNGQIKREATGSTVRHTSPTRILSVKIPLPPLAEQQAIVAEIEAEQKLVSANRELIARFEQKIQTTLARIWGETPAVPT